MRSIGKENLGDHGGSIAPQGVADSPVEFVERNGIIFPAGQYEQRARIFLGASFRAFDRVFRNKYNSAIMGSDAFGVDFDRRGQEGRIRVGGVAAAGTGRTDVRRHGLGGDRDPFAACVEIAFLRKLQSPICRVDAHGCRKGSPDRCAQLKFPFPAGLSGKLPPAKVQDGIGLGGRHPALAHKAFVGFGILAGHWPMPPDSGYRLGSKAIDRTGKWEGAGRIG